MIAVMGATGNTGAEITRRLLAQGAEVRALGRSEERLADLTALGAEPTVGDATDIAYLERAFAGVDAVYTLLPYDPTHPDYRAQQAELGEAVVEAIRRTGVRKVVALSSIGADVGEGNGVIGSIHAQEQRLGRLEDVDILFLRPGMFFESFYGSLGFIAAAGFLGDVVDPGVAVPMVASRDVAAYAADALLCGDHSGHEVKELHGPRDLTFTEVADILGPHLGHAELAYRQLPAPDMVGILVEAGLSPDFASQIVGMGVGFNSGAIAATGERDASLTPTRFEEFAGELAGAGSV